MPKLQTLVDTFNHIAFPPKLPGNQDKDPAKVERNLIDRLRHAVKHLDSAADEEMKPIWKSIEVTLSMCCTVNRDGMVNKAALLEALDKLNPGGAIITYVAEQNAALLLRRPHSRDEQCDRVIIEAFETSPKAHQTLAAQGALRWDFPATAVSLPMAEIRNPTFRDAFCGFLGNASTEALDEFAAKSRKAGREIVEGRDTVDPSLITEFLMTLLCVNGSRICPPVLRKRVKDDVCWHKAELPWRRSPFWLVLRVCAQRLLYLRLGSELGRLYYKFLVCVTIANLLRDLVNMEALAPEHWGWLNSKLCRRLAKLEAEKEKLQSTVQAAHTRLASQLNPFFEQCVSMTKASMGKKWEIFKSTTQRKITHLPFRAEKSDHYLSLTNSLPYLQEILDDPWKESQRREEVSITLVVKRARGNTTEQFNSLWTRYSLLAQLELTLELEKREIPRLRSAAEQICISTADKIEHYLTTISNTYEGDPEQLGVFILNVFELWVYMDECATITYPLLAEYHPRFHPELLDVLFLSRLSDLERLQKVQKYLHDRRKAAVRAEMTIFADPSPGCFADRYLELDIEQDLGRLQTRIETESMVARQTKKVELEDLNEEYKSLREKEAQTHCTQRENYDGSHDIRGCKHCYYIRCRRRLKISVHEDFLPSESKMAEKRAAVFELGVPKAFAEYRRITWDIICSLGSRLGLNIRGRPEVLLHQYRPLAKNARTNLAQNFTLASSTKSHLNTHYKWNSLPASERTVMRPLGLTFFYYDTKHRLWVKDYPDLLSFAHHFALSLPKGLPFSELYSCPSFAPDGVGPSSYEAVSNITDCPSTVTVHEFMAHETLMAGKCCRWISVLTELGASNINLGLHDAMVLFRHLALQAGPRLEEDTLRVVHTVFNDIRFCTKLIEQLNQHVSIIAQNWRETTYMETLLTLTIQLCNLGNPQSHMAANNLLLEIRRVTYQWISHLRDEIRNARQVDTTERVASYCLLAALLCRRTFSPQSYAGTPMDEESVQCFVEVTIAMQESMIGDVGKFSNLTLSMIARDIKMSVRIGPILQAAVEMYPDIIGCTVNRVLPNSPDRSYSMWEPLPHPHEYWMTATAYDATEQTVPQQFHIHLLEGHLMIDAKPLSKLPADIRNSETLRELFGNQSLSAFPSSIPGMSYVLAIEKEGNHIHLGYRGKQLIIRVCKARKVLEYVPRSVFGEDQTLDLPDPLVRDCVHWVNIKTGILEARRRPIIWRERPRNWKIDIHTRNATRGKSLLVDPHSQLAKKIGKIFLYFENSWMLSIYQPPGRNLSVELKNMNLSFHVNKKQLLQCKQLAAEIDPNQDAGTLYGLQSMLVLRNVGNRLQRSIITTLGKIEFWSHGIHVLVRKANDGYYGRYLIDDVLGCLSCPAESRLLYTKAQLHAFTAFTLPDPLTARMGAEEALACLQSGRFQPWAPLAQTSVDLLQTISRLTPQRRYYPTNLRCQQTVCWDEKLPFTIQNDRYEAIVEVIFNRSRSLSLFNTTVPPPTIQVASNQGQLRERAQWRRSIYTRPDNLSEDKTVVSDYAYFSKAQSIPLNRASNVFEVVSLLREQPSVLRTTHNLANILQTSSYIGGYGGPFSPNSLEDTISADFADRWGGLVRLCQECKPEDAYYLMFHLGLMAYSSDVNMEVIRVLVAFFTLQDLRKLTLPLYTSFEGFSSRNEPDLDSMMALIKPFWMKYKDDTPTFASRSIWKRNSSRARHDREEHDRNCLNDSEKLARLLLGQWPCPEPSQDDFSSEFLDLEKAREEINRDWLRRYKNMQLMSHIDNVQAVLDAHSAKTNYVRDSYTQQLPELFQSPAIKLQNAALRLEQAMLCKGKSQSGPDSNVPLKHNSLLLRQRTELDYDTPCQMKYVPEPELTEIEKLVASITESDCAVKATYGKDLQLSIAALKEKRKDGETISSFSPGLCDGFSEGMSIYHEAIKHAREEVQRSYNLIYNTFSSRDAKSRWLQHGSLWACISPITILEQLRSASSSQVGLNMKEAIISYGLTVVKLQRLMRMKESFAKRDQSRLDQEYNHPDHAEWDYLAYPDWILLEIDGNVQIRHEQVTVAMEMICPTSGTNSVLQMNMGQGKTSVIMPMVACALSDGELLTRLLVPKALIAQTAQILQARLGGLVGKKLLHIPFSRRTPTTIEFLREYRALHQDIIHMSGVVLGVPEHALSFKLSGLQRISDSKLTEAAEMVDIQNWIDEAGRDVLDECDFTLAVKTQLIYPSGSQLVVDGNPDRWDVIMTVLGLVSQHLRDLARELPQSVDVMERAVAAFPIAYLLRKDAEVILNKRVADDVCSGRGAILPVRAFRAAEINIIQQFLLKDVIDDSVGEKIQTMFQDAPRILKRVYLIRGLLVHRVLLLCLKKRWNVQYGLHPDRDPMAVPFHAKGVPSEYAEWGHPDVAIVFTCLAFYHQGLKQSQCRQGLQAILRSDDPATEYDRWTQGSTLPEVLRHWNVINVDDAGQIQEIWRNLRFSTSVINHFLKNFVFPVHARQFAVKLQTSGWDVPQFKNLSTETKDPGKKRSGLTTGFSGTNDNRRLLPMTIAQHDLPELLHTNAEVLTYLLQKRNRGYKRAVRYGRRLSELELLTELTKSKIRVLIDAGAFVLEMDNKSLTKAWLDEDHDAQAAVYFEANNEAWVQYRTGLRRPLIATPFSEDMTECVVYLDEAHTRGTDLKLPAKAKGALTLGLNQTKDHTVQAAMRLRQLGTTQSIIFIAPPEVHQSIMDTCEKSASSSIDSSDVVRWLLHQTCSNNRDLEPLFFSQGADFCRRIQAAEDNANFLQDLSTRERYMQALQKPERQTLEQLYGPQRSNASETESCGDSTPLAFRGNVAEFMKTLQERQRKNNATHNSIVSSALEEVEQEREVAYEIEEEREVQRPLKMEAYEFPGLHPTLLKFAKKGFLKRLGVVGAASVVNLTELRRKYDIRTNELLPNLYVSDEFPKTVKLKQQEKRDQFMRPINWLLCNIETETTVVLIPEEAEKLIPILRTSAAPSMHLITYAAPVTRRMLHFNRLNYYTIPPLPVEWTPSPRLTLEIGIFAGRLYFEYAEYDFIREHLQTSHEPTDHGGLGNQLAFLQDWLALRRQGQDISHTPMGYVCQDRNLRPDHPFFVTADVATPGNILQSSKYATESKEGEYYDSEDDDVDVLDDGDDEHVEEHFGDVIIDDDE
ncbi:hypothetical protein BO71DRAFT_454866 [Aspergillus ellipticus CBS 707.79]|uniref:ubiquitinyl hydrolase 1 n=1 Tax=Aspergillus ellipticus CBS 707.79 TaxID=1448320 RepID=A0A319E0V7_9EURO|nr:hypothetical protein BO71DRAFT_454866 [Aspergillus ellipticus CBS 707.79]